MIFSLRKTAFCCGKSPARPAKPGDTIAVLQTDFGFSAFDGFVNNLSRALPCTLLRFAARQDAPFARWPRRGLVLRAKGVRAETGSFSCRGRVSRPASLFSALRQDFAPHPSSLRGGRTSPCTHLRFAARQDAPFARWPRRGLVLWTKDARSETGSTPCRGRVSRPASLFSALRQDFAPHPPSLRGGRALPCTHLRFAARQDAPFARWPRRGLVLRAKGVRAETGSILCRGRVSRPAPLFSALQQGFTPHPPSLRGSRAKPCTHSRFAARQDAPFARWPRRGLVLRTKDARAETGSIPCRGRVSRPAPASLEHALAGYRVDGENAVMISPVVSLLRSLPRNGRHFRD